METPLSTKNKPKKLGIGGKIRAYSHLDTIMTQKNWVQVLKKGLENFGPTKRV
jgi:hypothetical protein